MKSIHRKFIHPTIGTPPQLDTGSCNYSALYNSAEVPLFLHPEYCVPSLHLDFDREGKIIGISDEGIETIKELKLDNPDLNGWRKKIYEDNFNRLNRVIRRRFRQINPISQVLFNEAVSDLLLDLIRDYLNITLEYTLFRETLLRKIDYFFIEPLAIELQSPVNQSLIEAIESLL